MGCADAQERVHPGWRAASLIIPAMAFVCLVCMPGNGGARAQNDRQKPLIVASKFIHLAPGAEVPLDITVWPPEAVQPGSTLMIRGLPARVALGQGKLVSPGVWGIPADISAPVKMTAPPGTEGVSELTIMLVTASGSLVTDFRATLVIETPGGRAGYSGNAPPKKADNTVIATMSERLPAVEPKPNPMAIPVPPPAAPAAPPAASAALPAAPVVLTAAGRASALKLMEKGDKSSRVRQHHGGAVMLPERGRAGLGAGGYRTGRHLRPRRAGATECRGRLAVRSSACQKVVHAGAGTWRWRCGESLATAWLEVGCLPRHSTRGSAAPPVRWGAAFAG